MQCSFAADRDGPEYDLARADDAPDPASLRPRNAPGPWESAFLGPTPERDDGTRSSTHRAWLRISDELPDDRAVHDAAIAFIGDISWNAASPLGSLGPAGSHADGERRSRDVVSPRGPGR